MVIICMGCQKDYGYCMYVLYVKYVTRLLNASRTIWVKSERRHTFCQGQQHHKQAPSIVIILTILHGPYSGLGRDNVSTLAQRGMDSIPWTTRRAGGQWIV